MNFSKNEKIAIRICWEDLSTILVGKVKKLLPQYPFVYYRVNTRYENTDVLMTKREYKNLENVDESATAEHFNIDAIRVKVHYQFSSDDNAEHAKRTVTLPLSVPEETGITMEILREHY